MSYAETPLVVQHVHGEVERVLSCSGTRCSCVQALAIDGNDLISAGFAAGPGLGKVLDQLLHAVVDDPSLNRREELLRLAEKLRT